MRLSRLSRKLLLSILQVAGPSEHSSACADFRILDGVEIGQDLNVRWSH